jgi:flagellin
MSLRIATNVQSLSAQRFLNVNHEAQNRTLERLASGSRINHAGDDAAGLAISDKLRANIRSMQQAVRNANDGISLVQVAEGSMNEISNILVRVRELSIQAASDTISDTERAFVDKEVQQLKSEIDRIANSTEFNGIKLLNGTAPTLEIQVGINNNPTEDRFVFEVGARSSTLTGLGLDGLSSATKEQSQSNLAQIDEAIRNVNENRLESANSRIKDTDVAEATSDLVKQNILTQANVAVLSQANANQQLALKLIG